MWRLFKMSRRPSLALQLPPATSGNEDQGMGARHAVSFRYNGW